MNSNIYILSRPIRSGKTTALRQWLGSRQDVAGILTPDVMGKRMLYNISTQQTFPLETSGNTDDIIQIGRFSFDAAMFDLARQILTLGAAAEPSWLVIDEVGKLELEQHTGLEPALSAIIRQYQSGQATGRLLLVVRDYLLTRAIRHYGLTSSVTVSSTDRLPR